MISKYLLLEITTADSNYTRPSFNFKNTVVESSASRAALSFMAMAFSGHKQRIQAKIKVQSWSGNIKSFTVLRTPVKDKQNTLKYKHHIV